MSFGVYYMVLAGLLAWVYGHVRARVRLAWLICGWLGVVRGERVR